MELSTDQKGAIAESAIVHAAAKLGIGVYRPVSDGERYDLIFDLGAELVRVQCKWASLYREVVVVRAYSNRRTATGILRRPYTIDEIDASPPIAHSSSAASTFRPSASTAARNSRFASLRAATTS